MTDTILILGGTGKTGRQLTTTLRDAGEPVRTAARSGADAAFDWYDPSTHGPALDGVTRLYLVPPALRLDFADAVAGLLDRAEAAGVRHVTFLSAFGVQHAPQAVAVRAVELDLAARNGLTHSIVRPSWFMQNFTEGAFLPQVEQGTLALPAGDGREAFIDARDIAAVAAASLRDPAAHAGAAYDLTGPETLTVTEVAEQLSDALGRPVTYTPIPVEQFVTGLVAHGAPADYAAFLGQLLDVIAGGGGARPTSAVADVTGVEPRTFARFLADTARPTASV